MAALAPAPVWNPLVPAAVDGPDAIRLHRRPGGMVRGLGRAAALRRLRPDAHGRRGIAAAGRHSRLLAGPVLRLLHIPEERRVRKRWVMKVHHRWMTYY